MSAIHKLFAWMTGCPVKRFGVWFRIPHQHHGFDIGEKSSKEGQ